MYCILKTIQYICPTNSRRLHREDAAADSRQADSALRTTTGISYYETPHIPLNWLPTKIPLQKAHGQDS